MEKLITFVVIDYRQDIWTEKNILHRGFSFHLPNEQNDWIVEILGQKGRRNETSIVLITKKYINTCGRARFESLKPINYNLPRDMLNRKYYLVGHPIDR